MHVSSGSADWEGASAIIQYPLQSHQQMALARPNPHFRATQHVAPPPLNDPGSTSTTSTASTASSSTYATHHSLCTSSVRVVSPVLAFLRATPGPATTAAIDDAVTMARSHCAHRYWCCPSVLTVVLVSCLRRWCTLYTLGRSRVNCVRRTRR